MDNLVSIIVPIYNAEKYLKKCLESIINQTYKNLEIILINDGATDNSAKICEEYRSKDNRVKVLNKKNQGVAQARNDGLKLLSGKYVTFIDSDDWIDINYIEVLVSNLVENDADISICKYKEVINEDEYDTSNNDYMKYCYTNSEAINKLNEKQIFTKALWSKLYKTDLFENVIFPNIKSSEDLLISYKLLIKAKKIAYIDKVMYFYRKNDESITHRKDNLNLGRLIEGEKIVQYIKQNLPEQYESTVYNYVVDIMGLYNSMLNKKLYDKNIEKDIINNIEKYYKVSKNKMKFMKKLQKNILCRWTWLYRMLYIFWKMGK